MFKPLILGLITAFSFCSAGVAATGEEMPGPLNPLKMEKSNFLPVITVNDEELFNFTQNPLPDFFKIIKNNEKVIGVSQGYLNSVCFATVSYFNPNMGRLSNTKIKRYLKEATHFQITHQDSLQEEGTRFHYTAGAQADQIDVLMATAVKDDVLQVRTTCQTLSQMTTKENRKNTVFWTKDIAQKTLEKIQKGQ